MRGKDSSGKRGCGSDAPIRLLEIGLLEDVLVRGRGGINRLNTTGLPPEGQ